MKKILIVCIVLLSITACVPSESTDQPQGIIEYDVTYITNQSSMPTNLLPKKITLKFKPNKSITTIEGFMGMFSLSNISDFRKHTNTMLLKVMDNRFYYTGEKFEPAFFFDSLKDLNITFTEEVKIIAGLNCKKAIVNSENSGLKPFDVYYTEDIQLKTPNKASPFHSINGVLMQFNIKINNIEMRLTANKFKQEYFSSDLFNVPDNYKKISRDKMSGVLDKLLE